MFCSKCGKSPMEGSLFCHYCGNRLSGPTPPSNLPPIPSFPPNINQRKSSKGCGCLLIIIFLFGISIVANLIKTQSNDKNTQPAIEQRTSNQQKNDHKAIILPSAIVSIPTERGRGFDRTINRYGVDGVRRINSLLPLVAEKAAQMPNMDVIWSVDVSDNRSTDRELIFYADAQNGNRVYISEFEISQTNNNQ